MSENLKFKSFGTELVPKTPVTIFNFGWRLAFFFSGGIVLSFNNLAFYNQLTVMSFILEGLINSWSSLLQSLWSALGFEGKEGTLLLLGL